MEGEEGGGFGKGERGRWDMKQDRIVMRRKGDGVGGILREKGIGKGGRRRVGEEKKKVREG